MPGPDDTTTLPRRAGHLVVVELDGELVVYDPARREAHLLNPTAALVLDRCDGETTLGALTGELAAAFGVEPEVVGRDIRAALEDFSQRALTGGGDDAAATASTSSRPASDEPRPTPTPAAGADPEPWTWESGEIRALGARVRVRSDDEDVGRYVTTTFASLMAGPTTEQGGRGDRGDGEDQSDERPVATFDVVTAQDPVRLLLDGVEVGSGRDVDSALAFLHWRLNQLAIDVTGDLVLLHGSAVRRPDGVAVFPAESNSGKSTLAAGLVRAGFGYVTDEAVAIDPDTTTVRAYPKPISLDRGSWPLFADRAPTIPDGTTSFFRDEWHLDPRSLHPDALDQVDAEQPVTLVAFPTYVAHAPTTMELLRPAEALLGLVGNCFNLAAVGSTGVEALARIARTAVCVRFTVGDLDAAIDLVRSTPAPTGR